MNAQLKSPFDGVVEQVKQAPQHLSVSNARDLLEAIKKAFPQLIRPEDGLDNAKTPQELLKKTILDLGQTIARLNNAAISQNGEQSAADLSKLLQGQEKYIKVLERLSATLSANERQAALENAITEALDETLDKALKERFLTKFRANLVQISSETSRN